MKFPFTTEQFLEVFKNYNQSVWPVQLLLNLLALSAVVLSLKRFGASDKAISLTLSFLWIWMGLVYHIMFFAAINPAAYAFGVLFVIQGVLLLLFTFFKQRISFQVKPDIYGIAGGLLILYALLIYPILGYYQGHVYPASPTFGLPCPTTIFTFGILLWSEKKFPILLLVIPLIWSVIGFAAALNFGIKEDIGLLVSGISFALLIVRRNMALKKAVTPV